MCTRLTPMWPGFDCQTRRLMWVVFVVVSRPCSERFFSGFSGFPLSSETNISKFQFDLDYWQALHHEPLVQEIAQGLRVLLTLNNLLYFNYFFSGGLLSPPASCYSDKVPCFRPFKVYDSFLYSFYAISLNSSCILNVVREKAKASFMDNTRCPEVILELQQQREAGSSSNEEQTQSEDKSFAEDVHLANEDKNTQRNSTERLVTDLLQKSREEDSITSSSSSKSTPRRESEKRSNSELAKIVCAVLLDEEVHLAEDDSFFDAVNSRKESVTKSELTSGEQTNKSYSGVTKAELARRERERLHLIRTKVNAAVIIQRWFRKWTSIKRERDERNTMLRDVKNEQEEIIKEVAALTIQLAWRKHVRVEFEKNRTKSQKPKKAAPNSAPCKPKRNGIHIYGRTMQEGARINNVNSRRGNKRRPLHVKSQPTAAAMSYNMAMDLYHPMGSRQGNARAAMVTASTRVRPGSMKRTVNGWSHDIGFVTRMNGKINIWTAGLR